MQPMTSSTAIGSLMPDSPSSVRARRRRSVDPRSTANTAAASVAATVEPRSSASFASRSNSALAASAVSPAVPTVPSVASRIDVLSTGRISSKPADRPPSKRMKASAMTPTCWATSKSSKLISSSPSDPISMPMPSTSTRPGIRKRPAASEAASPAASRTPTIRATCPSCTPGEPCQTQPVQVSRVSCAGSLGGGGVSSSSPSTPAVLTAGLAGATAVRSASSGAISPSLSPASHAASSSGPASTHGIRSCTGAATAFAAVVRIRAEWIRSPPIRRRPQMPAKANGPPSSTV